MPKQSKKKCVVTITYPFPNGGSSRDVKVKVDGKKIPNWDLSEFSEIGDLNFIVSTKGIISWVDREGNQIKS